MDLSLGGSQFPRALEVRKHLYESALMGTTPRFRRLDRLHAFYLGLEYNHQELDWNGHAADRMEAISPDVMLPYGWVQADQTKLVAQKRPTAPMRLCPMIVDRFTGLLFSENRTPQVTVEGDKLADDFIQALIKKSLFWRTLRQARTYGGSMGSSLVTVHLKKDKVRNHGVFSFKAHNPKTVQDIYWEDPDRKIPAGVLIQYIFHQETEVLDKDGRPTGNTKAIPHLYRRIIDEEADIIFKSAAIRGNQLPDLEIDPNLSQQHGLKRFPGVWVQNLPFDEDLDGLPDCEGAYQMIEMVDRQVAQQNKGLLANMDPTLVISRDPKLERLGGPIRKGSDNALDVGAGGTANYIEIGGAGITASSAFVKDIRQAVMDKTQCVLVDPTQISGAAQSAKSIEYIYAPMLEKAGAFREQYGQGIEVLLEVALELARKWAEPLNYFGNARPQFDLPPRNDDLIGQVARTPGNGGSVALKWGPFFHPTPQDIQQAVATVGAAVAGGLMSPETGVRQILPLFGIEDIEAELKKIEEAEQKKKEAMDELRGLYPDPTAGGFPPEEPPPVTDLPPVEPPVNEVPLE